MAWPYNTSPLTDGEKQLRRQALNFYARVAFVSSLLPAIVFLSLRLFKVIKSRILGQSKAEKHGKYAQIPNSPLAKAQRLTTAHTIDTKLRIFRWWTQDKVHAFGHDWGHRDEWILAGGYSIWLLLLCVLGTGHDYFHLVKRFGVIAVSQMPLQYLMSLKALNPLAWIFRTSHEQVNRYHRVLGRVIYTLHVVHLLGYNAYFFTAGIWFKRFFAPIVFYGVMSSILMHALFGTATSALRALSYRLFFATHLVAALFIPVLIYFHAPYTRFYVVSSVGIFIVDLVIRRITTVTATSTVEAIPGTELIKVGIPLSQQKLDKFRTSPGSHVYLSLPPAGRTTATSKSTSAVFDFLYNPFTVASVTDHDDSINLVVRQRGGPMTRVLADFATATSPTADQTKVPLAVEGPYGIMTSKYKDLVTSGINRVVLIAGGVGATFAMPIYQAIQSDMPRARIQLVWAVRSAGDATWAVTTPTDDGKTPMKDVKVQMFLTGDAAIAAASASSNAGESSSSGAGIELSTLQRDGRRGGSSQSQQNRKRPDLGKIIDEAFKLSRQEPIAVLVCGPSEMAADARKHVRRWVMNGRDVWWHNESFGW